MTVSESSKRDILRFVDVDPDKISVIYNAYDERFGVEPQEEDVVRVRERYQLHDEFVLYAGNVKPHKNLERLIDAFQIVRKRGLDHLKLVLIGDEISKYAALRRAVHQYQLHKYVRFLGYLPEETLAVMYRLAGVFVFPSLYEGFGLPPLEAMASGTPVVTSNVSSLPEVAGDAAVLVDPYDPDAIADGIYRVLSDEALRRDLRQQRLARAHQFSWESSVRRVHDIYDVRSAGEASPSSRLADRHARRREGARGGLRALSRRGDLHAACTSAARCRRRSSVIGRTRRSFSGCRGVRRYYRQYLPLFPTAIEQFDFDRFDLMVSLSHCVREVDHPPRPRAPSVLLPHADAVRLGSVRRVLRPARIGAVGSRLMRPIMARLARWDRDTADRVDRYLAISHYVAGRIGRYYNREATVVYPPVDTDFFHPDAAVPERLRARACRPWFPTNASTSRSTPAGWPACRLTIVGDGPERAHLERIATGNVRFLGRRTDEDVRDLYRRAARRAAAGRRGFRHRAARGAGLRPPGRRARTRRRAAKRSCRATRASWSRRRPRARSPMAIRSRDRPALRSGRDSPPRRAVQPRRASATRWKRSCGIRAR